LRHVLGIDAGGTKTVGLLADQQGRVLAEARAGGANLQTHGELGVEKVFHELIEELEAKLSGEQRIDAVGLGIAGVDRPRDETVVRGILRRLGHRQTARVVNDAVIALVAGAPERFGIVILAGTGSIAYGLDANGRSARAGGYGYLLADEGSGYWLGQEALRAVVKSSDGRGPKTALVERVLGSFGIDSVDELLPLVYEQEMPKYRIAALASLVDEARAAGDQVARRIVEGAAAELALGARSVARQLELGPDAFPLVLAGGVFRACPTLPELLQERLEMPTAQLRRLAVEPAMGAVALALDLLREAG
jgi:N-acetylglucosamine kinase-like BadF-type ATPase